MLGASLGSRRLWCDETINEVLGIDERFVAIRGHTRTFVYDHVTGELTHGIDPASVPAGTAPLHPRIGEAVDLRAKTSPDGRWAAVGRLTSRLRVYDNTTGEMKFADDPTCGFDELAFSHDGMQLAAMARHAYIFGGDRVHQLPALTRGVAFTVEGELVGGAAGKLARWSLDGHEQARVSIRHKPDGVMFSRDGRHVAATTLCTGGLCMESMPDVVVADLARGVAILRFHDEADVTRHAALSPDARWLTLTDATGVRLLASTPRPPWSVPPVLHRWSPETKLVLLAGDRAVTIVGSVAELVELPSGRSLGPQHRVAGELIPGPLGFVEVAPDRHHLRFLDPDLVMVHERPNATWIEAISISADGARLAISDGPTIWIGSSGEP